MVDYWLLANFLTFALLLVVVLVWVKSFFTLVHAYVYQINFYTLSPHRDTNVRADQQAEAILSYQFIHMRDKMIKRIVFSTVALLVIIMARFVLTTVGVFHAAV
ncbi:hypothetical protein [Salmonella phage SKML-39]|uniref:Uncharacterized protein n=1 Tax=Salmonella phage SKML-39 TaxID=1204528 RepID=K4I4T4_9CAUD|nr:hypothetical protein G178_gp104 [Salmonella phage SKML-39]AFU64447.1 hypothetical protein [Salmonella phage SKML-39]